ncbi:glycosyltransferase family 2 protein [Pukyongiella litopenaei]|uniref:Glycosyltransferase n=1 Tax=Pukyongiella litopenaei TaxID=2605946 RepID=A0A2S0MPT1_9RHOB|nr:glycosyltransferase [Pukyongiella litopenaei]AVO37899.1 glycosyltransferase [Pukyongiella litopenaei]
MTGPLTISVVIVSRDRPQALRRCLLGVSQLFYRPFEVVVVADAAGLRATGDLPFADRLKTARLDEANISAARNLGIAQAAGELIAFIDDDAVPEPTWLDFLSAPFRDPAVAAAGGFVRGRNGISFQSRARMVDRTGATTPIGIGIGPDGHVIPPAQPGLAVKTEGTNMALRRSVLAGLGGFDPAYRFFLDETDLNLRLAANGLATAIVPRAEVHHGFAASPRRRADRVPVDLTQIGASWAVFLHRHCPSTDRAAAWRRVCRNERQRALRHLVSGALEPRDVRRLMHGLHRGFEAGLARSAAPLPALPDPVAPFRPLHDAPPPPPRIVAGRWSSRHNLAGQAQQAAARGGSVTLFRFSRTAFYHKVRFTPQGYWEQTGGLFGKSERSQPLLHCHRFAERLRYEIRRVGIPRGLHGN